MQVMGSIAHSARARPTFTAALVLTLAAAAVNASMVALMALGLESLLPGALAEMGHFTEVHHRIHDLTFGFLFLPTVVGVAVQLGDPRKHVAGLLMALIPSTALALTVLLTVAGTGRAAVLQPPWLMVMAPALIAMALHPAGGDFFASFAAGRISRPMLALTAVAAVPLLIAVTADVRLQRTVSDDHAVMGHYGFMAAFGMTVLGVALLASLRPRGWRLTAWMAGALPILLGAASLGYSDATSSLGTAWAVAAVAWGAGFIATAERQRTTAPDRLVRPKA